MTGASPVAGFPPERLREKVREAASNRPGVYRMMGGTGIVIYVGKSKRIRTRLLSYFRARREEKAWRILREARGLDWEYTPSEFASLLRELELIKQHRPLYNVRQKRDGNHSFLKITSGPAPRLQVARRLTDEPGSYYGPLRGGKRIVDGVKELNDLLMLRDCRRGTPIHFSDQLELFGIEMTPLCPRYELRRCMGPCAARCSEAQYARGVERVWTFLLGDEDEPLRGLRRRMSEAVDRWEFEHAAMIRNRIARLEMLRSAFLRVRQAQEELSFLYAIPGIEGEHEVYAIRSGSIRGVYPAPQSARDRRQLLDRVAELFREPESPTSTSSRQRLEQVLLVSHWFRTRPAELVRTFPRERWSEIPLASELNRLPLA